MQIGEFGRFVSEQMGQEPVGEKDLPGSWLIVQKFSSPHKRIIPAA